MPLSEQGPRKSRILDVLENLSDDKLSAEAIVLKEALLTLGDSMVAKSTEQSKLDLLFFKASSYDFMPKSLLFLADSFDQDKVTSVREMLHDYRYLTGETLSIKGQQEAMASKIARALSEFENPEQLEEAA